MRFIGQRYAHCRSDRRDTRLFFLFEQLSAYLFAMDDWRKNLTDEDRLEIEAEDAAHLILCRKQRKRAQDAMRRATQRAGDAAVPLTAAQKDAMFAIYLEAQMRADFTGIKHEVDHRIPLFGCWRDEETQRVIHYIRGLHVPDNLRTTTKDQNRKRSNMFLTADPLIVPNPGEYDPFLEYETCLYGCDVNFGPDDDDDIPF